MCQMCDFSFVGFAVPQAAMLDSYVGALRRGWSPNTLQDVSQQQLAAIEADADAFLVGLADDQPPGRTMTLPDGREVLRLPMRVRWIWDGEFCGAINLRWQPGTDELPAHVSGHVGYSVVPWKRGQRFATRALRHMRGEAVEVGVKRLVVTTDADHVASQRVIENNGGVLLDCIAAVREGRTVDIRRYVIEV